MGKRELLLILAFLIAGGVVYQVTAPAPAPGERSFSPGQLLADFRRHLRGNRASAELTTTTHQAVEAAIVELKVSRTGEVTILGEDRADIEAELRVRSNGFDEAEANRLAGETRLKFERAGTRLSASISYPPGGTQRALNLTLKVPARLLVTLEANGNATNVSGVAGVELASTRGEARIKNIKGKITGTHRGGELIVADIGSIDVTTMGAEVQVERVQGALALNLRGGQLRASEPHGSVAIDSQGAEVRLERLEKVTGLLRLTVVGGSVNAKELATEARLELRNAEAEISASAAAPLAIYSEGGGSIELTPAEGGYQLDAVATNADITLPEGTLQVSEDGEEHRAAGAVLGGGPTITIRSARAEITIRRH
jgi:hypothetical protein